MKPSWNAISSGLDLFLAYFPLNYISDVLVHFKPFLGCFQFISEPPPLVPALIWVTYRLVLVESLVKRENPLSIASPSLREAIPSPN